MRKLAAFFDRFLDFSGHLAAVLYATGCLIVTFEVVMRYLLNRPQVWVVESAEYILLAATFLAAAWVLRSEGHIAVDLVPNALKPRARAMLNITTSIIGAVGCFTVFYFGVQQTVYHFQQGIETPTVLLLPKYPFLAVITAGFFLLFIQFVRRTSKHMRSARLLRGEGRGEEYPEIVGE